MLIIYLFSPFTTGHQMRFPQNWRELTELLASEIDLEQCYTDIQNLRPEQLFSLGQRLASSDAKQSWQAYLSAALLGHLAALHHVGTELPTTALFSITLRDTVATYCLQEAANQGQAASQHSLALLYRSGNSVIAADLGKAHALDLQAAQAGDNHARYELACDFYEGILGVVEPDTTQQQAYLTEAAEDGHAEAQYQLALFADMADDYETAYKWATAAAEKNHPLAHYLLAEYYREGLAASQSSEKFIKHMAAARQLGIEEADEALTCFLKEQSQKTPVVTSLLCPLASLNKKPTDAQNFNQPPSQPRSARRPNQ